ncbi:MAG: PepSY-associated TM helix domain-containing protein [Deltaproteobacteria bacterium]|nr:PepSY-associated TM helix domain-containing protein [Deltaproteobacteria bacterium]
MRWRHLFRVVHRDIGYVAVALTLAYCLSGIAVNHIDDWNPNYSYAERSVDIGPLPAGSLSDKEAYVVTKLGLDRSQVRGHFQETATELRVFLVEGQEARVDMTTGRGSLKTITKRAVFFEVNALHLNNLKGIWTYVADVFALALMILALTGMTMMKGDRGFLGRGKYFVGAGLLIPIGFLIYMYSA